MDLRDYYNIITVIRNLHCNGITSLIIVGETWPKPCFHSFLTMCHAVLEKQVADKKRAGNVTMAGAGDLSGLCRQRRVRVNPARDASLFRRQNNYLGQDLILRRGELQMGVNGGGLGLGVFDVKM